MVKCPKISEPDPIHSKPYHRNTKSDHFGNSHYGDVIMGTVGSQITSLTIVYSTVYSDADQRKHQSSASLAFVQGIHRGPVNSPHKWPVTRKIFHENDSRLHSGWLKQYTCGRPRTSPGRYSRIWLCSAWEEYLDNKVHGTYIGPTRGRQDPGGPHVGPMNLDIRVALSPSDYQNKTAASHWSPKKSFHQQLWSDQMACFNLEVYAR